MSRSGRRVPIREVFVGPRLRVSVSLARRARSAFVLVVLCVLLGALVAAALAVGIGFVVHALSHAFGPGS
jgi:nitrate reductase NapE component